MDVSVVLSLDLIPPQDACDTLILVGQQSVTGSDETRRRTVNVVFKAIPCEDVNLISEQLECLEQVLPCGIIFLGVLLLHDGVKHLVALQRALKQHSRYYSLFAVLHAKKTKGVTCCRQLHSETTVQLMSPETIPLFISMPCCLRSPLDKLPFVVRAKGEKTTDCVVVDANDTHVFESNAIWESPNGVCAVQLGSGVAEGGKKMLCVYVTFAPHFSCGRDVYDAICVLLPRVKQQPQGVMVWLRSEKDHALVYQWIFTPTDKDSQNPSRTQWRELKELIEDGAGEKVWPLELISDPFLGPPQVPSTAMNFREKPGVKQQVDALSHVSQHKMRDTYMIKWVSLIVLAVGAVVMGLLWPK